MYLLRLDDASYYMHEKNWNLIEALCEKYVIKPIVGVIPNNHDVKLIKYGKVNDFWDRVHRWQEKDWTLALHGYTHVYETKDGGINPVNMRSEFAGLPLERQKEKIRTGYSVLKSHEIHPDLFYAPSHTFDLNTLKALKEETDIRVISDTVANDVYYENDFFFIPQQAGSVRRLPFKTVTFCYHPNIMKDSDFDGLENFLKQYGDRFGRVNINELKKKHKSIYDKALSKLYFLRR